MRSFSPRRGGVLVAWSAAVLLAALSGARADLAAVRQKLDSILDRPVFARGIHGCVVQTLDTRDRIYSRNPDLLLMTASNLKLITSAAALEILGPEFRYSTGVYTAGEIDREGVLHGDLVLKGSGDPLLDEPALQGIIEDLKARGFKRVAGAIVGDTGDFDRSPYGWGWSWDYLSASYAAPAGALNFNKNVISIVVEPAAEPGSPARVTLKPSSGHMRLRSSVMTGERGSSRSVSRERDAGATMVTVTGSVPAGGDAATDAVVAVLDPAQFTVDCFRDMLISSGIPVDGRARKGSAPAGARMLARHVSKPLREIVTDLNKWSDNLIAECLLRTLGSVRKGSGSVSAGRDVVMEFLEKQAGIEPGAVSMADGSGLSRLNLVTCDSFIRLLDYMYRHRHGTDFMESLPVAGVDGTLRTRMKDTPAEGKVRAKTGYIGGVSSLSGYVTTAAGQPLAFSLIFNNQVGTVAPCREAQDEICAYLAGLTEKL
ncbi:MAG: D-alanyl-D-alanine carboxypeptidase DacC [Armatimonadota bacterium]|nr:MAG: D-alanyl-D-alanine carboxypeptidase DacC [Armatimonadota bacterium]